MNAKKLPLLFLLIICVALSSCQSGDSGTKEVRPATASLVKWQELDTLSLDRINANVEAGKPTVDVGIYFPSNFDPDYKKVTMASMLESFLAAKEIYKPTGLQLNLLFVKTGEIDPSYLAIQANEVPGVPVTEYENTYEHMERHPARLTGHAREAFDAIVEPDSQNDRTIYLIALQDVFYPFLEVSEGRNWTVKSVRTGGLSFPTYSYGKNLPRHLRGVITISNLSRGDRSRRTIAHELGHKLMNVSHEYRETHPGHEVYADGGLMLYGNGEEIPSGKEGRWHLERLLLSPFIYTFDADGSKVWNEDYQNNGHYYDPIYGDKVVRFKGVPPIDPNW